MELMFDKLGFAFTEYFPSEFAEIRAWADISSTAYIQTFELDLLEFITNSKSGMFFFYTSDGKYLVKSLKKAEFVFFQKIFQEYYAFLEANPNSFVNKFFGMYQIKRTNQSHVVSGSSTTSDESSASSDICFIIMESIFYSDLDVTKIYDLKGSTKGRELSQKEKASMKVPVLKDLDFLNDGTHINVGRVASQKFVEQLQKGVKFLHELQIMDYSLLLGIHYRTSGSGVPQTGKTLRQPYMFRYDHGGISGVDNNANEVYFCGLIDILQRFNAKKRVENVVKRIASTQKEISCVPPKVYADRMVDFLAPCIV
jgi:1-phosphatidylinositol-4-phosphate 5-kinase